MEALSEKEYEQKQAEDSEDSSDGNIYSWWNLISKTKRYFGKKLY